MAQGVDLWGPHAWKFIHYVALGYPIRPTIEQKQKYKLYFYILQDVLPCIHCAEEYGKIIEKFELTDEIFKSRHTLFDWTVNIHNEVNRIKNKPIIDYKTAFKELNPKSNLDTKEEIEDNKKKHIEKLITEIYNPSEEKTDVKEVEEKKEVEEHPLIKLRKQFNTNV